jgi:hypothetical protein
MHKILRSIGAVLVGAVIAITLSLATDAAMHALHLSRRSVNR